MKKVLAFLTTTIVVALMGAGMATSAQAQPAGGITGNYDGFSITSPNQTRAVGWAMGPNANEPVQVAVTVNDRPFATVRADLYRKDVDAAFPGRGLSGWSVSLNSLPAGEHKVCAIAGGVSQGCKQVYRHANSLPTGNYEGVTQSGPGKVAVRGWALDPDTKNAVDLHIYVDGKFNKAVKADTSRKDVGRVRPGYGDNHGFRTDVTVAGGSRQVCVYAINIAAGNNNPLLGCRRVAVVTGNPQGRVDTISQNRYLVGWALDPDTVDAIAVHVYANGNWYDAVVANNFRADVGKTWSGWGDNHGFTVDLVRLPAGRHVVCAYGINQGAGSVNTNLGCVTYNK